MAFEVMDRANILIIGGGVVGCAIAQAVSRRWDDVFLVEQLPRVGMATSTRNSGVIHSGFYYPKDSLKARHCVAGNRLTYEFCAAHNVPHRRTGKLIVATSPEEAGELEELAAHGRANGVEGIRRLDAAGLFSDEVAALLGNTRYRIYPVRGEYCEIRGPRASLINSLVYPLPHAKGLSLGIHFTKTLWGTVLVGPTARYVQDKNDYEQDRLSVADFARNAQKMLPEVTENDLHLAYSGLRPKLVPPDRKGYGDFVITRDPAVPPAIQLIGIESPGLTAAPSIAEHVFQLCAEILE